MNNKIQLLKFCSFFSLVDKIFVDINLSFIVGKKNGTGLLINNYSLNITHFIILNDTILYT